MEQNHLQGSQKIYETLEELHISFEYHEHPPAPTIEIAKEYWKDLDSAHCKNLFFRNHKGNKHYLVVFEHTKNLEVRSLELLLKQGKISFASDWRLEKYLGVQAGSISPLSLVNDSENHVYVFFDKKLLDAQRISFHPGVNTASIVIRFNDFIRYMDRIGNLYEFIELYPNDGF
jgi:Ala-tRNA(Pro) deacylase